MNIIEINGVQYAEKEKPKIHVPRRITELEIMALVLSGQGMVGSSRKSTPIPKIDIATEYGLIQQKKSLLSKSQRDWVDHQFHLNFTKIEQP